MKHILSVGTLALVASGLFASDLGLIDQPQTFPWTIGLLPVTQQEAGGLAPGEWRVRTSTLWFNTYRYYGPLGDPIQLVDQEGLIPMGSAAWSPAEGWELGVQAQGWFLGGGIMDGWLSWFHTTLGVPNQGRDQSPPNQLRNFIDGVVDDRGGGSGLTQAALTSRWFTDQWSLSTYLKLPVARRLGWGWTASWGAGALAGWGDRWPWGPGQFRAGLSAGLGWAQADDSLGSSSPWLIPYGVYGGWEWTGGPRLLIEGTGSTVPRSGAGYATQPTGLLTMGVQWPWGDHWTVETAMTEEFLTWATMEVGFQAGLVYRGN